MSDDRLEGQNPSESEPPYHQPTVDINKLFRPKSKKIEQTLQGEFRYCVTRYRRDFGVMSIFFTGCLEPEFLSPVPVTRSTLPFYENSLVSSLLDIDGLQVVHVSNQQCVDLGVNLAYMQNQTREAVIAEVMYTVRLAIGINETDIAVNRLPNKRLHDAPIKSHHSFYDLQIEDDSDQLWDEDDTL